MIYYKDYLNSADSEVLKTIRTARRRGKVTKKESQDGGQISEFNQILITADTETSKLADNINNPAYHTYYTDYYGNERIKYTSVDNKIVIWTIALSTFEPVYTKSRHRLKASQNEIFATLYGTNGFEFCECLQMISDRLQGNHTIVYFHNLSYDYEFLKAFFLTEYGSSTHSFFLDSHKILFCSYFCNDKTITFKDSYMLYGAGLATFCKDMKVPHPKLEDSFEYSKVRNAGIENFEQQELEYAERDVVALSECISYFAFELSVGNIHELPLTKTGIPRRETFQVANKAGHNWYNGMTAKKLFYYVSFYNEDMFNFAYDAYHGGFTRCAVSVANYTKKVVNGGFNKLDVDIKNKYMIQYTDCNIEAYDFASSYPFCMIGYKYPMGKWRDREVTIDYLLQDDVAVIAQFDFTNIRLKDIDCPFPLLQLAKLQNTDSDINNIEQSNGRVVRADHAVITLTNVDFRLIYQYYDWDACIINRALVNDNVDYLPKSFRNYIWQCWHDKSEAKALKLGDSITALRKIKLNSLYGMTVQYPMKPEIVESANLNSFEQNPPKAYEKYIQGYRTILPYAWGIYITSYAQARLFELINCTQNPFHDFLYSDTDSVYSLHWDKQKLGALNIKSLQMLEASGYGILDINGRKFLLGEAEFDGSYKAGTFIHSKCYAVQYSNDSRNKPAEDTVKITVAGVPKKFGTALFDSLDDFKIGYLFQGDKIRKNTKCYINRENKPLIEQDGAGDYYSFSCDLVPCDYLLGDCVHSIQQDFEQLQNLYESENIEMQENTDLDYIL